MDQREADAIVAILQPLLRAFEVLLLVARHFHPPQFTALMAQLGTPDADLNTARFQHGKALTNSEIRDALLGASEAALRAFAALRQVAEETGDVRGAFRAFRYVPMGLETLYPLAALLPPVNQFFLDPALRADQALQQQFLQAPPRENTGVMHFASQDEESGGERGSVWLYVPEHYTPDRRWPLVMALHGGSGTGHQFLWSWLRDARSRGAILVAPTSIGGTWALSGEDVDTPNLLRILEFVRTTWQVDAARLLLTGMSDGGTFTYVSGLEPDSPFTHLAPVSAAFHPMLAGMSDPARLNGLPIHIVHGALDWMFPAAMAREAQRALAAAGANVTYREIDDLSHTYPREMNAAMLEWLMATPSGP